MVDPIYKTQIHGKRYQVTLTGFAGYYINPRTTLENIKQLENVDKADIEKYLILQQNPQIIQYLYDTKEGNVVTINHNNGNTCKKPCEVAPSPEAPAKTPAKGK